ncbi:MAG: hypothetical protein JSW38_07160, partial [Dehalococcoidia bacterium]
PGVYILHEGDRVESAVEAAGGFTSDAVRSSINLASTRNRSIETGEVAQNNGTGVTSRFYEPVHRTIAYRSETKSFCSHL